MIFVEFSAFARRRSECLDDEQYRALQNALLQDPESGPLIPGTGGLRKIRWTAEGRGKRGGVRVIYYPVLARSLVLMLLIYPKNEQEDLTSEQKRILKSLVQRELAWREEK
ncbi:MAG: type II toxin-antitoxin system RelE/ParE family toxin [Gemmatimonadetes bacterium]|nr:type II toxin-antitoxin system RelE/ParE family toxin [Gemmatimonadota bacterium]